MAGLHPSTPCAVLDIDGVLADVRHRLHHLDSRPKDWAGFFGAMAEDGVLPEGLELARQIADEGHAVVYLTGRNESYRAVTQSWLEHHGFPAGRLVMRPDRDRRPARLFKPQALRGIAVRREVLLVVDDDPAVVDALLQDGWPVRRASWMPEDRHEQKTLFAAQETDGRT